MSPQPLPWHARAALLVGILLAALVGLGSYEEILRLRHLSEIQELLPRSPLVPLEVVQQAEAVARASMFGMRGSRTAVLAMLFLTCMVTSLAVLRLWRPLGFPRAGVLRLASITALGCALLRTVDGAQQAVIVRRIAAVLARGMVQGGSPALSGDPALAEAFARLVPDLQVAAQVVWTLIVAGTFVMLSQYFRSARARELFTSGDPTPP